MIRYAQGTRGSAATLDGSPSPSLPPTELPQIFKGGNFANGKSNASATAARAHSGDPPALTGRPVSRQMDYIRMRQPGERDEIMRPAHDGDRRRFARHWAAYQDGRQALPDGTPLVTLFSNNPELSRT